MSRYKIDWPTRISSDDDTVDLYLWTQVRPVDAPSQYDLETAIEWLALYGAESLEDAEPFMRVIAFLQAKQQEKVRRDNLAAAKRDYAAERGIPVSQVRISR